MVDTKLAILDRLIPQANQSQLESQLKNCPDITQAKPYRRQAAPALSSLANYWTDKKNAERFFPPFFCTARKEETACLSR